MQPLAGAPRQTLLQLQGEANPLIGAVAFRELLNLGPAGNLEVWEHAIQLVKSGIDLANVMASTAVSFPRRADAPPVAEQPGGQPNIGQVLALTGVVPATEAAQTEANNVHYTRLFAQLFTAGVGPVEGPMKPWQVITELLTFKTGAPGRLQRWHQRQLKSLAFRMAIAAAQGGTEASMARLGRETVRNVVKEVVILWCHDQFEQHGTTGARMAEETASATTMAESMNSLSEGLSLLPPQVRTYVAAQADCIDPPFARHQTHSEKWKEKEPKKADKKGGGRGEKKGNHKGQKHFSGSKRPRE
jgi:hypothetical protein